MFFFIFCTVLWSTTLTMSSDEEATTALHYAVCILTRLIRAPQGCFEQDKPSNNTS